MINNEQLKSHKFLAEMHSDEYYPKKLVDKGVKILIKLCEKIESDKPKSLESLYKLTHAATEKFNSLEEEFADNESEIETVARECIAAEFVLISKAYGFDADAEELISNREW